MVPILCKLVFVGLAVGWYTIRLPHLLRSRRTPIATSRRGLRERVVMAISGAGLGFIPLAYVVFGFGGFADRPAHVALLVAGTVVAALALLMFHLSHAGLGREWSVSLELRNDHRLRTDGVYAYVRHPMYAAFWLWALAQALLLPNWIASLSGLFGFGALYLFRVPFEERMMREQFGEPYTAYCEATPRILPWRFFVRGSTER